MTRRAALLAVLSIPMADIRVMGQGVKAAQLTIPLDMWGTLKLTHGKDAVTFTTADIFAILKGSTKA